MLPSILYFPNFLFEFPDRIYLESTPEDEDKHRFYQTLLQDVLDSIGEGANVKTHILDRAESGDKNAKRALDSVLAKMGANISATVSQNWNRIFAKQIDKKEIVVNCESDDDNNWYIELRLKDAAEIYSISERSLGFRWFFAFLMLTHYRGARKGDRRNVLFLFDEPASNLHPSAQSQLLESFGRLTSQNCSIIYTTHSHHMINPKWLEGTFVVKNEGLEYDSLQDDYSARKTVISLEKYRSFAANHPKQSTYFQPVLDVLDYCPSKLEDIPNIVMIEGKNDFYTLNYFNEKLLSKKIQVNLMPGSGAGSLDDMIRLYIAWGRDFVVLLDSDKEGKNQALRYHDLFGIMVEGRLHSLGDINSSWQKREMEEIIELTDRIAIQTACSAGATKYDKKQFNRAVQELYLTNQTPSISQQSLSNIQQALDYCDAQLKRLSST